MLSIASLMSKIRQDHHNKKIQNMQQQQQQADSLTPGRSLPPDVECWIGALPTASLSVSPADGVFTSTFTDCNTRKDTKGQIGAHRETSEHRGLKAHRATKAQLR